MVSHGIESLGYIKGPSSFIHLMPMLMTNTGTIYARLHHCQRAFEKLKSEGI